MISEEKIWDVRDYNKEKAGCLAAELNISPLVTGILLERGFEDVESMRNFLYGSDKPFHDPFLIKDMGKAVARIEEALAKQEMITVYGDYDVDGISASSLLYLYLRGRGAQAQTYIPKRKSEGYGLNDEALKHIAEGGTTLVITVDCGISGVHEVKNAPQSLDIIITDHHTVPEHLPPTYAIINPKQADCTYPFKNLSGVGVAFKLCQALEQKEPGLLPDWTELTELAALGTVADIVPLVAKIERLSAVAASDETTKLIGLKALIKASGCPEIGLTSDNIGFSLALRLNAVGRLEHAQSAVELLVTDDEEKAENIAADLNRENALRQEIGRQIMEEAELQLAQQEHIDTAIVLASEGWHQGVIGIVASRLVEKYHLPTILFSLNEGMAKGSCRSIPTLNLYEAIAAEADILSQFGGHHQAAGLTLPADKLAEFTTRFKNYVREHLKPEDYYLHQIVDCSISGTGEITVRDLEELSLLEPCYRENPALFCFSSCSIAWCQSHGQERNHLQFNLEKGDYSYRCVMWNSADLLPFLFESMLADVAFQPKINVWNNKTSVQLHAVGIKQELALGDLRQNLDDKWFTLQSLARVKEKVLVCLEDDSEVAVIKVRGQEQGLAKYLEFISYADLLARKDVLTPNLTVVLWQLPQVSLKSVLNKLQELKARVVFMLFNHQDENEFLRQLFMHCPDREAMAVAYKTVMQLLQEQTEVPLAVLCREYGDKVSPEAVKIMQELAFITVNDGIIKKGIIKRCALQDAPLFVKLQEKRASLEQSYKENLRMSQFELLRC
ncbi:MAG: single-stranded-DNA-specific exonuclease RecJ [Phascolarctobacterium sp.]